MISFIGFVAKTTLEFGIKPDTLTESTKEHVLSKTAGSQFQPFSDVLREQELPTIRFETVLRGLVGVFGSNF